MYLINNVFALLTTFFQLSLLGSSFHLSVNEANAAVSASLKLKDDNINWSSIHNARSFADTDGIFPSIRLDKIKSMYAWEGFVYDIEVKSAIGVPSSCIKLIVAVMISYNYTSVNIFRPANLLLNCLKISSISKQPVLVTLLHLITVAQEQIRLIMMASVFRRNF